MQTETLQKKDLKSDALPDLIPRFIIKKGA
jgi:hypothetical protein